MLLYFPDLRTGCFSGELSQTWTLREGLGYAVAVLTAHKRIACPGRLRTYVAREGQGRPGRADLSG